MPTIFFKHIPEYVIDLCRVLHVAGYEAYIVGGAPRDIALGLNPKDFDIATNALPDCVETLFPHTLSTGKKYGTITVLLDEGRYVEITTFRGDTQKINGQRLNHVTFTDQLCEDLAHRDFTINAIAYDPITDNIRDPFSGLKDIALHTLKTVGDPKERIFEDALRMMRAVRIKAEKKFVMTEELSLSIKANATLITNVSNERIAEELCRIVMSDYPTEGVYDLLNLDLLKYILPELSNCAGISQRQDFHQYDVFGHIAYALKYSEKDLVVRLAILLHDIGKAVTSTTDQKGIIHFYGHEVESAKMAATILERLKFSNHLKKAVVILVRHHMRNVESSKSLRRLMSILKKPEQIRRFASIRYADKMSSGKKNETILLASRKKLLTRMEQILADGVPLKIGDLAITGNDVIKHLGLKPGPKVGTILNSLLHRVIDNPELNQPDTLLQILTDTYENIGYSKKEWV